MDAAQAKPPLKLILPEGPAGDPPAAKKQMTVEELSKSIVEKGALLSKCIREMRSIALATRERGAAPAHLVYTFASALTDMAALNDLARHRVLSRILTESKATEHRLVALLSVLERKGVLTGDEVTEEAKALLRAAAEAVKAAEKEAAVSEAALAPEK